MIKLRSVYKERGAEATLYELLMERTPEESISHKEMPTKAEHDEFVASRPYHAWFLIWSSEFSDYVGATYLSKQREIGVFIFARYRGRGFGKEAVSELMRKYPGRFVANINPENTKSIKFFEGFNARHIQNTYEIPSGPNLLDWLGNG